MTTEAVAGGAIQTIKERVGQALITPVRAMRLRYLPLLMVYFAYGALGIVGVAQSFWVRQELTLTPVDLASLGVWLTVPWTIKMVFGQFVDCVPLLGSQRRAYVFVGATFVATGLIILAGAAGGWISFASPDRLYVISALLTITGVVIQDVVADAMSTEVVRRHEADGTERPKDVVKRELGLVQVLGRLALTFGIFSTAGLAGWLAKIYSYETVFLLGLIVPIISVTGAVLVRLESVESKKLDWRITGGGLAFGVTVLALGIGQVPYAQEIVFVLSMTVVCVMLVRLVSELDVETRKKIFFTALIIFVFRATPGSGEGYRWFSIDVLGFDEVFFGTLAQIGAGLSIAGIWLLSDTITRKPVAWVLLWLTVFVTLLSLPDIGLIYGVHEWTEETFGFGARTIAIIDTTAESPFAQLAMIPMLTLIAVHAPEGRRATWFALMASLMNLALVAGQLQTKYLNQIFEVTRGQYDELGVLVLVVVAIGFVLPVGFILWLGKRLA